MRRIKRMVVALVFLASLVEGVALQAGEQNKVTHPCAGAPGEWRLIGQVMANLTADHDVIVVKGMRP